MKYAARMKTPAFFFDLGNVLVDFSEKKLVQILSEASDLPFSQVWETRIDDDIKAVETGMLPPEDYFEKRIRSKIPHWEYEDLIQVWYDVFIINPKGRGLFLDLKHKGRDVYILSNLAEFNKIAVERKFPGFFEQSTANFFSYELGLIKPDLKIYEKAAELAGVCPEDCAFLDDRAENVEGARRAGWKAFHFTPETADHVEKQITALI